MTVLRGSEQITLQLNLTSKSVEHSHDTQPLLTQLYVPCLGAYFAMDFENNVMEVAHMDADGSLAATRMIEIGDVVEQIDGKSFTSIVTSTGERDMWSVVRVLEGHDGSITVLTISRGGTAPPEPRVAVMRHKVRFSV